MNITVVRPDPDIPGDLPREMPFKLSNWLEAIKRNRCPECDGPIWERRQIRRCVYAMPCWHMLYQGRIKR